MSRSSGSLACSIRAVSKGWNLNLSSLKDGCVEPKSTFLAQEALEHVAEHLDTHPGASGGGQQLVRGGAVCGAMGDAVPRGVAKMHSSGTGLKF